MLSQISWAQFFLFAGGATVVWVLFVLRHHILGRHPKQPDNEGETPTSTRRIWSVKEDGQQVNHAPINEPPPQQMPPRSGYAYPSDIVDENEEELREPEDEEDTTDYQALETLALEIHELTASLGIATTEEKLLEALRYTIHRYPMLDKPAQQSAINHLVIRCSLQDCRITLQEATLASLWE
ncbi:hypothetical protein HB364_13745 [Pseudoflavitalea sp. X16]|uniref:hypothetical protein n=1 Tax=Paraflavitalea devenefica TaxID=2716334 RepID=UPI001423C217|nr:hypothetical protein [Paraflavitalea devenefica]NII26151.1 hypothetical protein [Paraflavitalea devenefica]